MKKTYRAWTIVLISAFVWGCQSDVGELTFDVVNQDIQARDLIVVTKTFDGTSISDYELTLGGPISLKTRPVTNRFQSSDVTSGKYAITVKKTGYVGTTKSVDVLTPEDGNIEYRHKVDVYLTKKSKPVKISHAAGGSVVFPEGALIKSGLSTESVRLDIPPGAIAGEGETEISVTLVKADPTALLDNNTPTVGTGLLLLVCEPANLKFVKPVKVSFPLVLSNGTSRSITFEMAEKQGNVDEGKFEFTGVRVPVTLSSDYTMASAEVMNFATWQLMAGCKIELDKSKTVFTPVGISPSCSAGFSATYSQSSVYTRVFTDLYALMSADVRIQESIAPKGVRGYTLETSGRHLSVGYRIINTSSNTVLTRFIAPAYPVEFITGATFCHDSGG